MRSRVIPGSSVTMDRRVPVRRLNNLDLPTFGLPAMTINGNCDGSDIWIHKSRIACEGGLHPHYFSMSAATTRRSFSESDEEKRSPGFKPEAPFATPFR